MSVGLPEPENILPIRGIRIASAAAGIRNSSADDLVLLELASGCRLVAVFTQNQFCAAPVIVAKNHMAIREPRFLLINAGNANAGTGEQGVEDARQCCTYVSEHAQVGEQAVLPFSTGVIGRRLPKEKIKAALPNLFSQLSARAWIEGARGIMTTDTVPKAASRQIETEEGVITISGIAKGSGMICPNMATMLGFIATDAKIDSALLNELNKRMVEQSFNRITVDGDTSTNDACVLISSGTGVSLKEENEAWIEFEHTLLEVYHQLAQAIVRDGEGATKLITLNVLGAKTESDAEIIARAVAHSPLVKTAMFASDANWGRVLAAIGRAGVPLNIQKVNLFINNVHILKNGNPHPDYTEAAGAAAMAEEEINMQIELGLGPAECILWTSDLSYDYVKINAEYRT